MLAALSSASVGAQEPDPYRVYQVKPGALRDAYLYDTMDGKFTEKFALAPGQYVFCRIVDSTWCEVAGKDASGSAKSFFLRVDPLNIRERQVADMKAAIDLDPKQTETTVYSDPKYAVHEQTPEAANARVAWPNEGAQIRITDNQMTQKMNPLSGELEWDLSYQIYGVYTPRTKPGEKKGFSGWIKDQYIADPDLPPVPSEPAGQQPEPQAPPPPAPPPPARPTTTTTVSRSTTTTTQCEECLKPRTLEPLQQATLEQLLQGVKARDEDEFLEELNTVAGKCILNETPIPKSSRVRKTLPPIRGDTWTQPAFLQTLGKHWENAATLPPIEKPGGGKLTGEDVLAIDMMARTIYGEMASCFTPQLQYPKTVARTIVNRARAQPPEWDKYSFERGQAKRRAKLHPLFKNKFVNVMASPFQFSAWNNNSKSTLKQMLCPPRSLSQNFAPGHKPYGKLVNIWKQSLKIAYDAVTGDKQFMDETAQVKSGYYTSRVSLSGLSEYTASVGGAKLSNPSCVRLWK